MAVRIRKTGSVIATFPSAQQVDISHLNDSVRVGDGTNLMGPLQNVGGTLCYPIYIAGTALSAGDASAANQTSGAQKTQIVDDSGTNTVDATAIGGGVYALKVDVVSSVGGAAAPAFVDDAAFTVGTSQGTPAGGTYRSVLDAVDDNDYGVFAMTQRRALHASLRKESDGSELLGQKAMAASIPVVIASDQGALTVSSHAVTNAGTFAVQDSEKIADNAAFTDTVTKVMPIGFIYDEVAGTALTENDIGAARMNVNRSLISCIEDGVTRARYATVTAANALKVDASGVAVPITDNAGSLTIDSAAATAKIDVGLINAVVPLMGSGIMGTGSHRVTIASDNDPVTVKQATAANLNASVDVKTINAVVPLMGNGATGTGSLRVTLASDPTTNTNPYYVAGGAAVDGPRAGNPVPAGGSARLTTLPTLVSAAADTTDIVTDGYGRVLTAGAFPPGAVAYQAPSAITNTTETTIVTLDANNCLDIIWMVITNNSDVQSIASLRDATAGTVRGIFLVPARGGITFAPPTPFAQTTKNNNWTLTMTTTATSTNVMVYFGKRPT